MEELMQTYGYLAVYIGTLIEGEVAFLAAITAAKLGYFQFYLVLVFTFLGAYTRDWLTFLLARKTGRKAIDDKPKLKKKVKKVVGLIDRYPNLMLTGYRLMYGFVTVFVMMAGLSDISLKKFALFSALSNLIWVLLLGGLGYLFAEAMVQNLEILSEYKGYIFIGLIGVGLSYWGYQKLKESREKRKIQTEL